MKTYSPKQRTEQSRSNSSKRDLKLPFGKKEGLLLLMLIAVVINLEFWLNHHPLAWRSPIHHSSATK